MINSYKEAVEMIQQNVPLHKETLQTGLEESCGHTLAEDIIAGISLPSFDNSAMDGYAVKFSDCSEWTIAGEISAGNYSETEVNESNAISIMTGAKLPPGADTVIPIEKLEETGDIVKLIHGKNFRKGDNVRKAGEDISAGTEVLKKGTVIEPKHISLLGALGYKNLNVLRPLKIAVLATGDELVDIDCTPQGDQIRATNLYSLLALIKQYGMQPVNLGFSNDSTEAIRSKIEKALNSDIDILLTTGGVSVGKRDYLKQIFEEIGAEEIFWRVFVKPGKPLYFAKYGKQGKTKLIFGLPGNPLSSFVSFTVFVMNAVYRMLEIEDSRRFSAVIEREFKKKDEKRHFVLAESRYDIVAGRYVVKSAGFQSSGGMATLSRANCLLIFEEDKKLLQNGESAECMKI